MFGYLRLPMATDFRLKEILPEITEAIVATYTECNMTSHLGHKPLPSREAVNAMLADLLDILFPGYFRRQNLHIANVEYYVGDLIDGLHDKLIIQITRALRHEQENQASPEINKQDLEAIAQQRTLDFLKNFLIFAWCLNTMCKPLSKAILLPRAITKSFSAIQASKLFPFTGSLINYSF